MELFSWMKRNRITGKQMAKDLKVSEPTISNVSSKKTSPSLLLALKIKFYTRGEIIFEHLLDDDDAKAWEKYLQKTGDKSKS